VLLPAGIVEELVENDNGSGHKPTAEMLEDTLRGGIKVTVNMEEGYGPAVLNSKPGQCRSKPSLEQGDVRLNPGQAPSGAECARFKGRPPIFREPLERIKAEYGAVRHLPCDMVDGLSLEDAEFADEPLARKIAQGMVEYLISAGA
jgi:hypothetical protein